jgi:hypothetical protein
MQGVANRRNRTKEVARKRKRSGKRNTESGQGEKSLRLNSVQIYFLN